LITESTNSQIKNNPILLIRDDRLTYFLTSERNP